MKHPLLRSSGGFSLIEVLIASAILGFALLGLSQLFLQGSLEIYRAKNKSRATQLVDEMMEMIVASPYPIENYQGFSTNLSPANTNPVKEDLLRWKQDIRAFQTTALGTISIVSDNYRKTVIIDLDYLNLGKRDRIEIKRVFSNPFPISP
jgi:prepilin-type N-terminal cleavage/methylation domain-containing protein